MNHELLRRKYFYVLPGALLKHVEDKLNRTQLDFDVWEMDRYFGTLADQNTYIAGFLDGQTLSYDLLRHPSTRPTLVIDDALIKEMGWEKDFPSAAAAQQDFDDAIGVIDYFKQQQRAYCGWLLTNLTFVKECDAFCERWHSDIQEGGLPKIINATGRPDKTHARRAATNEQASFLSAYTTLLGRWHLQSLIAPKLPLPPGVQQPILHPASVNTDLMEVSAKARILPDPPQHVTDVLRDNSRLASKETAHLADWLNITRKDNTGKQTLTRFARVFELQHYWCVLHERHGEACRRRKKDLMKGFANYLNVSFETIRDDLRLINQRLENDD